jgi:hypothetical protein
MLSQGESYDETIGSLALDQGAVTMDQMTLGNDGGY